MNGRQSDIYSATLIRRIFINYTWTIHNICDGKQFTYHTYGLNVYGSLELELNLPLIPKQAALFINLIAKDIAEGKRYLFIY